MNGAANPSTRTATTTAGLGNRKGDEEASVDRVSHRKSGPAPKRRSGTVQSERGEHDLGSVDDAEVRRSAGGSQGGKRRRLQGDGALADVGVRTFVPSLKSVTDFGRW